MRRFLVVMALSACGSDSEKPVDAQPMGDASTSDSSVALNGCRAEQAMDRTAPTADRTIRFGDTLGELYSPRCMKIALGQTVTWDGAFGSHPMVPGLRVSGSGQEQDNNPVPRTANGGTLSVTFSRAGSWGYYCTSHPGMEGLVIVQ